MKSLRIIIILFSLSVVSQNVEKIPGIYKTYNEFKNNSPSIKLEGTIKSQDIKLGGFYSEQRIFTEYLLKIKKEKSKMIGKIFGFSDGEEFYIGNDVQTIYDMAFFKVEIIGEKLYYFESLESFGDGSITRNHNIILKSTGEIQKMTKRKMKNLLKSKPELYQKFKKTRNKEDHIKQFLIEYQKK
ncbi:hypothetical protein ACFQ0R_09200 [Psychroflexus salinarum]|uniref:DUF4468 domain-containing protein n=1 Tax=Psychroflexus salinarum TaxID=546024 RepID=A0ABW3GRR9_9FLAO